mmetsp:Transcript_18701/g.34635  ORF Transcript_18701/g.34635 Transcript_18701/m.34635 type:complete len:80 (+) Transcript_18701:1259-1498(+)
MRWRVGCSAGGRLGEFVSAQTKSNARKSFCLLGSCSGSRKDDGSSSNWIEAVSRRTSLILCADNGNYFQSGSIISAKPF